MTKTAPFLTVTEVGIHAALDIAIIRHVVTLVISATVSLVTRNGRAFGSAGVKRRVDDTSMTIADGSVYTTNLRVALIQRARVEIVAVN